MFYKPDIKLFFKDSFSKTLLFSILAHLVILLQVEWRIEAFITKEEIIEVNLVQIRQQKVVPRSIASKLKPLPHKQDKPTAQKKPLRISEDQTEPSPPKPALSIKASLDKNDFNLGKAPTVFEEYGLEKPGIRYSITSKIGQEKEDFKFSPETPPKEGKLLSFGKIEEDINFDRVGDGVLKEDINFIPGNKDTPAESKRSVPRKLNFSPKNYIEGEVLGRKILYKPGLPRLNIERDVTVSLKFSVLPNGEIDRIFPYLKGDSKLEIIATKLLRQYRFEPLFKSDDIQEGVIHFTISRKD